ncbi:MAG: 16S rRNA (adenine(1518)-N(6)/adenine(1519)-N(6))-dimethyltransferase RsmA [Candidatus Omnitrophota bacterium]
MNISELKRLWQEHGFHPTKRLGQNFLIDKNIRDNILNTVPFSADSVVVEIGAGFGVMTFEAAERCRRLYAVEKDEKICAIMAPLFSKKENLELVRGDILEFDLCSIASRDKGILVLGNIPYYITTPVIEKIITERKCIRGAYIVVQDELASRIVSPPGRKDYGALTCFVQFYAEVEKVFKIKKNSFYPRPNVDSCLLKLAMSPEPRVKVRDKELMFRIVRKAFQQRRKKILNSLSHGGFLDMDKGEWQDVLQDCGVDIYKRAEDISLLDYARISDAAGER